MVFNCVELVAQQLRKFRATFASVVAASSCAKGRCLTGNWSFLHQRHRCVYHGRQLGRSGVTSSTLHGKENGVRHQIRFHSVVGASLHQRNLAAFSSAAFAARHRFFPGSQIHRQRRGKCHGNFSAFSRSLPGVLVVTLPGDFGGMDGTRLIHTITININIMANHLTIYVVVVLFYSHYSLSAQVDKILFL